MFLGMGEAVQRKRHEVLVVVSIKPTHGHIEENNYLKGKEMLLTLDKHNHVLLRHIFSFQLGSDLALPQAHDFVHRQNVTRRPQVHDFVEGPRVIDCLDGEQANVLFLEENSYKSKNQSS